MRRTAGVLAMVLVLATATPATASVIPTSGNLIGRLSLEQRVGQLFMVSNGASAVDPAVTALIRDRHVGNVMLSGRSSAGVGATATVTRTLQATAGASTGGYRLAVSTDQEGGAVQVLSGPGFSTIPRALTQGTWDDATLRTSAAAWGRQLLLAGVSVDLAPVADTVPSAAFAPYNAPIGAFSRQYGYTPALVSAKSRAFAAGMTDAGVAATPKHFPGLGRVTGNTDTTSGVTDTQTTRTDPYPQPFRDHVAAGARWMMVSTAYYSRIDAANPAAFSPTVVTGMMRSDLGFTGVIVSDDLCNAKQVAAWTPAQRAQNFINAGGTMVLCGSSTMTAQMYDAVLARAKVDAAFAAKVNQAALIVTRTKATSGSPTIPSAGDLIARSSTGDLLDYGATGHGAVLPARRIGSGWSTLHAGATVDWNGDGTFDVVASFAGGDLRLYPGYNGGGFAPATTIGRGWDGYQLIPGTWLDGARFPGMLAKSPAGQLVYYANAAGTGLTSGVVVVASWPAVETVMVDADGNGHSDLVTRGADGTLRLYRSDGAGRFVPGSTVIGTGWQHALSMTVVNGFAFPGSTGLLVRFDDGSLRYYALAGGQVTSGPIIGHGWGTLTTLH
ncbi:glycoside hydrolase family 3 N-terminal domain-containing protein [Tersicoccus sp. MR15.9]|uniref:glycoside hydrolase family 3 N-terminal domain-containing protein n=1 Tax=Tersicoccus mangrovi TaxID=3121635 RepID=UPI002FE649EF